MSCLQNIAESTSTPFSIVSIKQELSRRMASNKMQLVARLKHFAKDVNDEHELRDAIALEEEPIPTEAPPGHVVIRVKRVALNPAEYLMIRGMIPCTSHCLFRLSDDHP